MNLGLSLRVLGVLATIEKVLGLWGFKVEFLDISLLFLYLLLKLFDFFWKFRFLGDEMNAEVVIWESVNLIPLRETINHISRLLVLLLDELKLVLPRQIACFQYILLLFQLSGHFDLLNFDICELVGQFVEHFVEVNEALLT